jgi:hypothetical protein
VMAPSHPRELRERELIQLECRSPVALAEMAALPPQLSVFLAARQVRPSFGVFLASARLSKGVRPSDVGAREV